MFSRRYTAISLIQLRKLAKLNYYKNQQILKSDIKNDKISSQWEVRSNIQLLILFLNLCMLSTKNRWGVGEGRVFPHFEELINAS